MSEQTGWFSIGHTTIDDGVTGCTVILFPDLCPAAVDIRGGAPGTREAALLDAGRLVGRVDALLLTGGSAFGLAAADGVMRFMAEQGRGFPTSSIPVPIVPGAVIYDLGNGTPVWPSADDGYHAAASAKPLTGDVSGRFGAGTGAAVAKLGGGGQPGGIGIATIEAGDVRVTAVVVLNAVGDIIDPATARTLAAASDAELGITGGREIVLAHRSVARAGENTTIGAVLVDGPADRDTLRRCCIAAHDAFARCVIPAHTLFDGDTFFAVAQQSGESTPAETMVLTAATELAVQQAIVSIFT